MKAKNNPKKTQPFFNVNRNPKKTQKKPNPFLLQKIDEAEENRKNPD